MQKSALNKLIFLYLYLPILLFYLLWIRPLLSVPALVMIILALVLCFQKGERQKAEVENKKGMASFILCIVILMAWCLLSGMGGYCHQSLDWEKHNFILRLLTEQKWPIIVKYKEERGVLVYYIAAYLIPALIGKLMHSFRVAEIALLIWTAFGLYLTIRLLETQLNMDKPLQRLVLCLVLFLFSSFITPVSGIYGNLFPDDVGTGEQWYWLSITYPVQFSSNMMLLRWVPQQAVSGWLMTLLLLQEKEHCERWGVVLLPAILYSTFVFVGLVFLSVLFWITDCIKQCALKASLRRIVALRNLLCVFPALILILFILCSMLQERQGYGEMSFRLITYRGRGLITLLCLELTWGLWPLLLAEKELKNPALLCATILLLLLPLFQMGEWNDLCMRASIPAMFILCILTVKNLLDAENEVQYKMLLLCVLLLCSVSSMHELITTLKLYGVHQGNSIQASETVEQFVSSSPMIKYQYFCWDMDGLIRLLIRR